MVADEPVTYEQAIRAAAEAYARVALRLQADRQRAALAGAERAA